MNKAAFTISVFLACVVVLSCKKNTNSETPIVIQERIFTGEFLENRGTHALCKTHDNHFAIVAGKGVSRQLFVAFLDASLNTIWEKTYGSEIDNAGGIVETSDGGLLIASNKQVSTNPMQINYGLNLLKLSVTGEILWEKNYLFESSRGQDYPVVQTSDGGFVIGVSYHIPDDSLHFYPTLFKVNHQGDSLWLKGIPGSFNCFVSDIALATDQGFLVAGSIFLYKTDSLGKPEWDAAISTRISAIQVSTDCSVMGFGPNYMGDEQVTFLSKVSGNGQVVWESAISQGYDIHTYSICPSTTGGFVMTEKINGKVHLIKTDQTGQVLSTQNLDAYNACGLFAFQGKYCCYTQRLNATHTNFDLVVRKMNEIAK
jgi:hypothetical protein